MMFRRFNRWSLVYLALALAVIGLGKYWRGLLW